MLFSFTSFTTFFLEQGAKKPPDPFYQIHICDLNTRNL